MPITVNDLNINVLTYMEALKKIVDKINEVINVVNNLDVQGYVDVTNQITISQIQVRALSDVLYRYLIECNATGFDDVSKYDFYIYNENQGVLIHLNNEIDFDDILWFTDVNNWGSDGEFWNDSFAIYAKRIIP